MIKKKGNLSFVCFCFPQFGNTIQLWINIHLRVVCKVIWCSVDTVILTYLMFAIMFLPVCVFAAFYKLVKCIVSSILHFLAISCCTYEHLLLDARFIVYSDRQQTLMSITNVSGRCSCINVFESYPNHNINIVICGLMSRLDNNKCFWPVTMY